MSTTEMNAEFVPDEGAGVEPATADEAIDRRENASVGPVDLQLVEARE